jgi:hypothetical protein
MRLGIGDLTLPIDLRAYFLRSGGAVASANSADVDIRQPAAPIDELYLPSFLLWTLGCMHVQPSSEA